MKKIIIVIICSITFINCSNKDSILENETVSNKWIELKGGNFNGNITKIITDFQNNVYAIGGFKNLSGNFYVAKWNGTSWSELGNLNANAEILTICIDNQGNVLVAGKFKNQQGKPFVAKWNGSNWIEYGIINFPGLSFTNTAICDLNKDNQGNLYAIYKNSNDFSLVVIKWNGNSWVSLNSLPYGTSLVGYLVKSKFDSQNNISIGGYLSNIIKYNGSLWTSINLGTNNTANSFEINNQDNLYALLADGISVKLYVKNTNWMKISDYLLNCSFKDNQNTLYFGGYQSDSNSKEMCNVFKLENGSLIPIGNISESEFYSDKLSIRDITKDSNGVIYVALGDYLYGNHRVIKYIP